MAKYEHGDVYLFRGDCGHEWVGALGGTFTCPVCGRYDGDHHLTHMAQIAVQVDDIGCAWAKLAEASSHLYDEKGRRVGE